MGGWSCLVFASALAACSSGKAIDAGSNDAGSNDAGFSASSDAGDGGAIIIVSGVPEPPSIMVSDGTSLYWVTRSGFDRNVWSAPAQGGAIQTVVQGTVFGDFLAVDDANVYYTVYSQSYGTGIYRTAKHGGSSPTVVSEPPDASCALQGTPMYAICPSAGVTVLGSNAYWAELTGTPPAKLAVKTAALRGGLTSLITQLNVFSNVNPEVGVTTTTGFLSYSNAPTLSQVPPYTAGTFFSFPMVPDGGALTPVTGFSDFTQVCQPLVSDTDAVFCENGASILRVASDGTKAILGTVSNNISQGSLTHDDTYVYWVDPTIVASIVRAPKMGGSASVIARAMASSVTPNVLAVDANAIYWDEGANILRLAK